MINKFVLVLSILVLFGFGQAVSGQNSGDWNSLANLAPDLRLIVELKGGNRLKGKFQDFASDSIKIQSNGKIISIKRDEISRVYRGEKRSRVRSALIGAGVGLGIGVVAGVVHERNSQDGDGLAAAAGVIYGIPIGASIGALAGGGIKKADLLYEAR